MTGGRALRAAVLLVLMTATVHADYKDSFRRGIQASRQRRWAEAAKELAAAIAQQPRNTGERVQISGMDTVPYVPHFYLGAALFAGGDCAGALNAWRALSAQGGANGLSSDQKRQLATGSSTCEQRQRAAAPSGERGTPPPRVPAPSVPVAPPPAPAPVSAAVTLAIQQAEGAVAAADAARRRVAAIAGDETIRATWREDPRLGRAEGEADTLLASARIALADARARANAERAAEAAGNASRATERYDRIRELGTTRLEELRRPAAPVGPVDAGTRAGRAGAKPAETAIKRAIPPPLLAAAQFYFSGRYDAAAEALAGQRFAGAPENLQAELFRAAALYALYLTGGERDATLLDRAREHVRGCRRLDPRFVPDATSFSPRFVEFYRSLR